MTWHDMTWAGNSAHPAQNFAQDLRYALRQMRKKLGFSVTVIVTLSLGVGANLAVFQLLKAILFTQLPIARPGELYSLRAVQSPFDGQWFYSYPAYQRLRQANAAPVIARSGMGSGVLQAQSLSNDRFSRETSLQMVSDNFFAVLGVSPRAGRFFELADDTAGQGEIPVILRYDFAREKFGSVSSVVGMKAVLNRVPVVVIGVAPQGFSGVVQGSAPDLWLPLMAQSSGRFGTWFDSLGPGYNIDIGAPWREQDGLFWLWVLARVPGAEKGKARGELTTRWTQALQPDLRTMGNANKDRNEREHILRTQVQLVSAAGGEGSLATEYSRPLLVLMGMSAMFFLIGCLNLGNLQLARLSGRRREIGVRLALGASRGRIVRQLMVEDALLLAIGSVLALVTCRIASGLLLHWASGREQLIPVNLTLGWEFFAVGVLLLIFAQVAFSVLPAWNATRQYPSAALHASRVGTNGKGDRSTLLLAAQVSLSLLLLSMAALFARTLLNLGSLDAGMDREHVLTIHLDLDSGGLEKQDLTDLNRRILDHLRALPTVRAAAMQMCRVPGCIWNSAIHVAGRPDLTEAQMHGEENHVSVDYFRTMGIPLLRGRAFGATDLPHAQPVAILNQAFAERLFGNQDPIGHCLGYKESPGDHEFQVVGVTGNAHVDGLRLPAPPVVYLSLEQTGNSAANIEVRAMGNPANVAADIRRSLESIDPNLPIADIVPLDTEFNDGLSTEKLLARLTATFAGLALAVAAIGFYGLLSFQVVRRTSEIGVRIALGSTRGQVLRLFLRQTLVILIAGIIPGIALTLLVGRSARTLFYGVQETDPWALLAAIGALIAGGLLATILPARRASMLDPVEALRAE